MSDGSPQIQAVAPTERIGWVSCLLALCTPFVVLWWMVPGWATQVLALDLPRYPIPAQVYLQYIVRTGSWPAFVHGNLGGRSAGSLTLGQLHHPTAYVSSIVPGYWEGGAIDAYVFVNLVTLGLVMVLAVAVLRRLGLGAIVAFLLAFAAVFNARMIDLFRYGAVQGYVAYVGLACLVVWYAIGERSRLVFVGMIASVAWAITNGHPQTAHGAIVGQIPIILLAPAFVAVLLGRSQPNFRQWLGFELRVSGAVLLGVLLAAAYLVPFYFDYVIQNTGRSSWTFEDALFPAETSSFASTFGALMRPFHTDVYTGFAGASVMLLPLFIPLAGLHGRKILPACVLLLWAWLLLILVLPVTDASPLYYYYWKYFPLARGFRVPGRVSMMTIMPSVLLLGWLLHSRGGNRAPGWLRPATVVGAVGIVALALYGFFPPLELEALELKPAARFITIPTWATQSVLGLGLAALGAVVASTVWTARSTLCLVAATGLTVLQVAVVLSFVVITEPKPQTPTWAQLEEVHRKTLSFRWKLGARMFTDHELAAHEFASAHSRPDKLLASVPHTVVAVDDLDAAGEVAERHDPSVASVIGMTEAEASRLSRGEQPVGARVRVLHADLNRLTFQTKMPVDGVIAFRELFAEPWQVSLDGVPADRLLVNGHWLGVVAPAGTRLVELRYESTAVVVGILVTLGTFGGILLGVLRPRLQSISGLALVLLVLCAVVGGAWMWSDRIHGGAHLGMRYVWSDANPRGLWLRSRPPSNPPARPLASGSGTARSATMGL